MNDFMFEKLIEISENKNFSSPVDNRLYFIAEDLRPQYKLQILKDATKYACCVNMSKLEIRLSQKSITINQLCLMYMVFIHFCMGLIRQNRHTRNFVFWTYFELIDWKDFKVFSTWKRVGVFLVLYIRLIDNRIILFFYSFLVP